MPSKTVYLVYSNYGEPYEEDMEEVFETQGDAVEWCKKKYPSIAEQVFSVVRVIPAYSSDTNSVQEIVWGKGFRGDL